MKRKRGTEKGSRLKVYFDLESNENEHPPAKSEFLWCIPTLRGTYLIDNIPFFVRDISLGDEISAEKKSGQLRFEQIIERSRNSTVRVLLKRPEVAPRIRKQLDSFGCGTELMDELSLLTVSIPKDADIAQALAFLDKEQERGLVGIEESSVRYQ